MPSYLLFCLNCRLLIWGTALNFCGVEWRKWAISQRIFLSSLSSFSEHPLMVDMQKISSSFKQRWLKMCKENCVV
jgi:hypothetical protein